MNSGGTEKLPASAFDFPQPPAAQFHHPAAVIVTAFLNIILINLQFRHRRGSKVSLQNLNTLLNPRTVMMLIKKYVSTGPAQNMGRAAAYSVVLFVVTLIISLVFYKATAEKKDNGRK